MTSDKSLANLQNRKVPIQFEEYVPNDELVHIPILFFLTKCVNLTDISTITQNVLLRSYKLYYLA